MTVATKTRRSGRRRGTGPAIAQRPWGQPRNARPPVEILSRDAVEMIHRETLRVLKEVGLKVTSDRAMDVFEAAGARVDRDNQRVQMDEDLVEAQIALAPSRFMAMPRNPERSVIIGDGYLAFTPCGTPAYCSDLQRGRREGTLADSQDLIRLGHMLNTVHLFGSLQVEPNDVPPDLRPLEAYASFATLTDKSWRMFAATPRGVEDAVAIHALAAGTTPEALKGQTALFNHAMVNSPLILDGMQADGVIETARAGQASIITAFAMAGAMAPITMAGTLVQQNAEILATVVLAQLARPGAPVVYGAVATNVDMKSGSPMFGTPEHAQGLIASGQLAARYRLPYRPGGYTASNSVDAQAIYETQMSLWASMLGQGHLFFHALGWLEGGLTCSFEKMIVDAEMLQGFSAFLEPMEITSDSLAFDAIAEVGPGGHYFGTAHTLARYEDAFYAPMLSQSATYQAWEEQGSRTATERAGDIWRQLLADYHPPAMDPAIVEEIHAYKARRSAEILAGE
ncbi:MAG: trimethylamine methyltransferase family protein [Pseudomonadota bacterium]